jgi:hypothetical protein
LLPCYSKSIGHMSTKAGSASLVAGLSEMVRFSRVLQALQA